MKVNLIIAGPPASGKGSVSGVIKERTGGVYISTGDIFREAMQSNSELGKLAKSYIDQGDLVPDDVTSGIVKERLSMDDVKEKGFILDGYPRTAKQAEDFLDILNDLNEELSCVVILSADRDVLIERVTGRLICPACARIYHETNLKPLRDGVCDDDNTELVRRAEDDKETFIKRLDQYYEVTHDPVINLVDHTKIAHVDSNNSVDSLIESVNSSLNIILQ